MASDRGDTHGGGTPEDTPQAIVSKSLDEAKPVLPAGAGTVRPDPQQGCSQECRDQRKLDLELSHFEPTDLGNADRFLKRYGADFLFVPELGWLAWDGRYWNADGATARLERAVYKTVKDIAQEALALKDSDEDVVVETKSNGQQVWLSDRIKNWGLVSQGSAHLFCIPRIAQASLTTSPESFDTEPTAINVLNGTIRISRDTDHYVTFHPHKREDRMTKIANVHYDPNATCPIYDTFFSRVQPNTLVRRHLHCWGGLSLTALPIAKLAFWYGGGRNGKSTLSDIWAYVMGDYAQSIQVESFLDTGRARKGGEASPDIAALPNVRFLRTSEPEKKATLAEGLIKLVTGGETLRARHLNRGFFEFRPVFKLIMQGNYRPKITGTDEGIWSRLLIVPWRERIPEAERDVDLPEKLRAEASGIFNRLLDGLCNYLDYGLQVPSEVMEATQEYREQSDPLGRFLTECCDTSDPDARVQAGELFQVYAAWARSEGEPVWSQKGFGRGLLDHGHVRMKNDLIYYIGLRLIKTVNDYTDAEVPDGGDEHPD